MQVVRDEEEVVNAIPQYDPEKQYTWSKDERFIVSGNDFGHLLHSVRTMVAASEHASEIIEKLMTEGVANGQIIEMEPTPIKEEV